MTLEIGSKGIPLGAYVETSGGGGSEELLTVVADLQNKVEELEEKVANIADTEFDYDVIE